MLDAFEAVVNTMQRPMVMMTITLIVFMSFLASLNPGVDYVIMLVGITVALSLCSRLMGDIPRTMKAYAVCLAVSGLMALATRWGIYYG